MTVQEFSDQFDLLYNNITSNQAPGLNEWEKSVFLTKGQEELVKNYFNPKSNPKQDGFDDSPKRQSDFSTLIRTYSDVVKVPQGDALSNSFDQRSNTVLMPQDLFISLNEQIMDGNTPLTIVPIAYEEYNRLMSKPYKYPPKYQVWRIIVGQVDGYPGNAECPLDEYNGYEGQKIAFDNYTDKPINLKVISTSSPDMPLDGYVIDEQEYRIDVACYIPSMYCFAWYKNNIINNKPELQNLLQNLVWPEDTLEDFQNIPTGYIPDGPWVCDIVAPKRNTNRTPVAELVGKFSSSAVYRVRYVKRPRPIILTNLHDISNELSISGQWEEMTSELPEELHEEILQRAVELAKVAWQGDVQTTTVSGHRSE